MKLFLLFLFFTTTYLSGFSQIQNEALSKINANVLPEKNLSDLKIYPNPCTSDQVSIDYGTKQITEIRISNIAGKIVLAKNFNFTENKIQIELQDIPNGIYVVNVKTVDQKIVSKKLLIARK